MQNDSRGAGREFIVPLAFALELFISQHVKAHVSFHERTAKASLVAYLCMISLKYREQLYNYPNIHVLVLPAWSSQQSLFSVLLLKWRLNSWFLVPLLLLLLRKDLIVLKWEQVFNKQDSFQTVGKRFLMRDVMKNPMFPLVIFCSHGRNFQKVQPFIVELYQSG